MPRPRIRVNGRSIPVRLPGASPGSAPGQPAGLNAASASSSSIALSWTLAGAAATSVVVERSADGSAGWSVAATLPGTATSAADAGLPASTAYYYRVKAVNGSGASAYSSTAVATTDPIGGTAPAPGALPAALSSMASPMMYVPLLGRTHDVHVANNGNWSSGPTWSTGVVPTSSQDVLIQAGATVVLDATGLAAAHVVVEGTLAHATAADTALACTTLSVMEAGTYTCGTAAAPIAAARTATVTFADGTFNTSSPGSRNYDPEMYGRGLLAVGTVRACGAARTPYVRMATELSAGATTLAIPAALADPTVAPTASTSALWPGSLQPGTYDAAYTHHNGVGETLPSPAVTFAVTRPLADPTVAPAATAAGGGTTGGLACPGNRASLTTTFRYSFVNANFYPRTRRYGETKASPQSSPVAVDFGNIPRVTLPALPPGATGMNLYADPGIGREILVAEGLAPGDHDVTSIPGVADRLYPFENTTGFAATLSVPAPPPGAEVRMYLRAPGDSLRMYGRVTGTSIDLTDPLGSWDIDAISAMMSAPDSAARTTSMLATPPAANATALVGWRAGDALMIPDTRQPYNGLVSSGFAPRDERVTVAGVSGTTVTFTPALAHDHRGGRDLDGVLRFPPHAANMTRNVAFSSANPAGSRGHALFSMMADVVLDGAAFVGLGRTRTAPIGSDSYASVLDNTAFTDPADATSTPTHIGTNQIGRYPVHFHHCTGPMDPPASGHQYAVTGCVVDQGDAIAATGATPAKWGIDLHNSHFGRVAGNVTYNCAGAHVTSELGNECCNVVEGNLGMRCQGTGSRQSTDGTDGDVFWARGQLSYWRDNVATGAVTPPTGAYTYGYTIFGQVAPDPVLAPSAPGQMAGSFGLTLHIVRAPILEFARNEAYGCLNGQTHWWIGNDDVNIWATQHTRRSDFRVWNHGSLGTFNYEDAATITDRFTCYGDPAVFAAGQAGVGVYPGDYGVFCSEFRNCDIQGQADGIDVPHHAFSHQVGSTFRVLHGSFRCATGISQSNIGTVGSVGANTGPRRGRYIDCAFDLTSAGLTGATAILKDNLDAQGTIYKGNLRVEDSASVVDFQRTPGDTFNLYGVEQVASTIPAGAPIPLASPPASSDGTHAWTMQPTVSADFISTFIDDSTPPVLGTGGVHVQDAQYSGTWAAHALAGTYLGSYVANDATAGSAVTIRTAAVGDGLNVWRLELTWPALPGNTTAATVAAYDGTTAVPIRTWTVNQRVAPTGTARADGAGNSPVFQVLGDVFAPTNVLYVVLRGGTDGALAYDCLLTVAQGTVYWGADAPGLTNAQNLALNGYCTGGAVAPADAAPRAGIVGLVSTS